MSFCRKKNTRQSATDTSTGRVYSTGGISKRVVSAASVGASLAGVAQHIPTAREISGQEEDQQHADDLHRLEAEQVHLGVAGAGAGAEEHQQHREREAGEQRHEAQFAGEALVVEPAEHGQQHGAGRRALGEIHEQQVVAHGVAQADHEDQADAAERQRAPAETSDRRGSPRRLQNRCTSQKAAKKTPHHR